MSSSAAKGGGKKGQQQGKQASGRRFGSGIVSFVRDVRGELGRVSWPKRDQLRQSTIVVLVIVLALGAYVAAWDFVFQTITRFIFL